MFATFKKSGKKRPMSFMAYPMVKSVRNDINYHVLKDLGRLTL